MSLFSFFEGCTSSRKRRFDSHYARKTLLIRKILLHALPRVYRLILAFLFWFENKCLLEAIKLGGCENVSNYYCHECIIRSMAICLCAYGAGSSSKVVSGTVI